MRNKAAILSVVNVVSKLGHFLFAGWVLMMVWNEIAYQYNQPEFGYWVSVGVCWLIHCITTPFPSHKKS